MNAPENCPRCNQSPSLGGYVNGFHPGFAWAHGSAVGPSVTVEARACLSCGLIWSFMEPSRFHRLLRTYFGELGRQFLDELDRGPYRDLPESDLAREIGDQVAELDAIARNSIAGKVVRRYRELRGVTWDQAFKEAGRWAELTRAEKLALFGWKPKKGPFKKENDPLDELIPLAGEIGRQFLDELDRGAYRDLPDTDLAREIGDRVAELDALARDKGSGKVVRRYRELRGVTWDQAIKDAGKWPSLTRLEKLALFGWIPKKAKETFDDLF